MKGDNVGLTQLNLRSFAFLRSIVPVVREAMAQASLAFEDIDAFGVTCGPGLTQCGTSLIAARATFSARARPDSSDSSEP